VAYAGTEQCDDGNSNDLDACRNTCVNAACGDGVLRTDLPSSNASYEYCDDGNTDNDDACRNNCKLKGCGDGYLDPGEECDDGNTTDTDTCSNDCTVGNLVATQLAAGDHHTCALTADKHVYCWGRNDAGQLGAGHLNESYIPVRAGTLANVVQVQSRINHTCALLQDGTVWCWGINADGQLGDNSTTTRNAPVQVSGITGAVEIAVGTQHACARFGDKSVKCWGRNVDGALGDYSNVNRLTPVDVRDYQTLPITTSTKLIAGDNYTCSLRNDSGVDCWRKLSVIGGTGTSNYVTQRLGAGAASTLVSGETGFCLLDSNGTVGCYGSGYATTGSGQLSFKSLWYVKETVCGTKLNNTVWCWGRNDSGQFGTGTVAANANAVASTQVTNFFDVATAVGVRDVAQGLNHGCARWSNNTIKCWGGNDVYSQLGDYTRMTRQSQAAPWRFGGVIAPNNFAPSFKTLASGGDHSCNVTSAGLIRCWGSNTDGQLGNGTTTDSLTPVTIIGHVNWVGVAAGGKHTCGVKSDGSLWCWGRNDWGQLGTGNYVSSSSPVQVSGVSNIADIQLGDLFTCIRKTDGTVMCWGDNSYAQLGDGTLNPATTPQAVPGLRDVTSLDLGDSHACVLKANTSMWCWGRNESNQQKQTGTRVNTPTEIISIARGHRQALAG